MIDKLAIATEGYLDSLGQTTPITIATGGYIVVEQYAPGRFNIKPSKPLPFTPGTIEEEEEILLIINLFLQHESRGLF